VKKALRWLIALAIVFFVDVAVFGLTGFSILLNYTVGGLMIWLALGWGVAALLPFWRQG
jgi:hypothetical protein